VVQDYRPDGATPLLDGAPPLPLIPEVRFLLMNIMTGGPCYAISLERCGYDVWRHPMPKEYVCGLIACTTVPETVRNDPEMLRRFPPKKLEGLDATTLCWRKPGGADQLEAA
jgi:hypothetical protein